MYLSDLIRDAVNAKLAETCVGKEVTISDVEKGAVTFTCKEATLGDDDGNCWIDFTDVNGNTYAADGQGIDIWFDAK